MGEDGYLTCEIGGVPVKVMIDSGSPINTVTEEDFERIKGKSHLFRMSRKCNREFSGYGGEPLQVLLSFFAKVFVDSGKPQLMQQFFVIKGARQSLLSKQTAKELKVLKMGLRVNLLGEEIRSALSHQSPG